MVACSNSKLEDGIYQAQVDDALTGATSSSKNAQKLLEAIYKDGELGQTIDVSIK